MNGPRHRNNALRHAMAETLKTASAKAGMSNLVLATRMDATPSMVHRFLNAEALPHLETLVRFGEAVGIPAWRLLRHAQRTSCGVGPLRGEGEESSTGCEADGGSAE